MVSRAARRTGQDCVWADEDTGPCQGGLPRLWGSFQGEWEWGSPGRDDRQGQGTLWGPTFAPAPAGVFVCTVGTSQARRSRRGCGGGPGEGVCALRPPWGPAGHLRGHRRRAGCPRLKTGALVLPVGLISLLCHILSSLTCKRYFVGFFKPSLSIHCCGISAFALLRSRRPCPSPEPVHRPTLDSALLNPVPSRPAARPWARLLRPPGGCLSHTERVLLGRAGLPRHHVLQLHPRCSRCRDPSFLKLNNVPWCGRATSCFPVHLSVDAPAAPAPWLL